MEFGWFSRYFAYRFIFAENPDALKIPTLLTEETNSNAIQNDLRISAMTTQAFRR